MARTTKKSIAIMDEGVVLSADVDSIDFVGSGVSASTVGNNVTANITSGGAGSTVETPTGTVDGVNTVFTVSAQPAYVISDGVTYFSGAGYTYGALTITMNIAPSSYIRAII